MTSARKVGELNWESRRRVSFRQALAFSASASCQISSTILRVYGMANPPVCAQGHGTGNNPHCQVYSASRSSLSQSRLSQFMAVHAVSLMSSPDSSVRQFNSLPSSRYSASRRRKDFTNRRRSLLGWITNHAWQSTPRANNAGCFGGKSSDNAMAHQLPGAPNRITFVNGEQRRPRLRVAIRHAVSPARSLHLSARAPIADRSRHFVLSSGVGK